MNKLGLAILILIIAFAIIAGLLYFRVVNLPSSIPFTNNSQNNQAPQNIDVAPLGRDVEVIDVTQNGFEPKDIKIKPGDKVVWTNNSGGEVNIASDNHPTHELYEPLNLGIFKDGETLRLVFGNAGVFKYHNHLNPSQTGTITVE